ncbi:hypothetical protein BCF74_10196 [Knoellia remsis]|uniref:Uncharacterized protein n=1 Tax=Knoellia remsis TaxID=407159 RepID=A0A2T0V0U4_9MICO|nr:hypothetical protein [Knoellia remsis]PRY63698.1 hypothetical protein BCF74_10196 [Knoellia remsis]
MTEHPQHQQPQPQPPFDTTGAPPAYGHPQQQPAPYQPGSAALAPQEQRTLGMLSHLIPLLAMVFSAGLAGFVGVAHHLPDVQGPR